jgi:hypothetical protein
MPWGLEVTPFLLPQLHLFLKPHQLQQQQQQSSACKQWGLEVALVLLPQLHLFLEPNKLIASARASSGSNNCSRIECTHLRQQQHQQQSSAYKQELYMTAADSTATAT